MNRNLLVAFAASTLILTTLAPAGVGAASPTRGFERLDVDEIDRDVISKILTDDDVEVIVELGGRAAGARQIPRAQIGVVARDLRGAQDRLDGSIRRLGGQVKAKYQYAYNGIKLRLPSDKVLALSGLPGVVGIHAVPTYQLANRRSVPFIASNAVWRDLGVSGQGQTIAIIDTGIDYTHANFGGVGTVEAFDANDPGTVEGDSFPTAKVIGGWDFVGDAYDPGLDGPEADPVPDADPLDCNGHGTHVAGTAAGQGVKSDQSPYTGPYDGTTYSTSFGIGPGVAPQAKLIALKVFGCDGGTNVLTDALEWVAVYNATNSDPIDVVNMSIGGIGGDYTADSQASDALVASGVSVVASAGNEGPNAYMTGAPGNATHVISVAASDVTSTFPGAVVDRSTGSDINGINENSFPGLPVDGILRPILDDPGTADVDEHLGCTKADYGTLAPDSIAVIQRGVCAFVEKGAAAEAAGAVGVIVVNRDDIVDPDEPPTFIGYTPDEFDIPMIGVGRGAKATLFASDGVATTLKTGPSIPNDAYLQRADFTSGGPRLGDSGNKPDVAAPGVNVVSSAVGLGYKATTYSGTSMAAPHVAGVAALVRQRHPTWSAEAIKAVIVGTAVQAGRVDPYNPRLSGSGMVHARKAVDSVTYVLAQDGTPSLSFGYDQRRSGTYTETLAFEVYNTGNRTETYALASQGIVTLDRTTVTVPARGSRTVRATASLNATQLAAMKSASQTAPGGTAWGSLVNYGGVITVTPRVPGPGRYPVRVTYRAVPRAESNIVPSARTPFSSDGGVSTADITLTNSGIRGGVADVYAWGLTDQKDMPSAITATNDIRAVGLQVLPAEALTGEPDPDDRALIFAINTYGRWSGGFQNIFQIDIYGDGPDPEFSILSLDSGLAFEGAFNGQVISLILDAEGTPVSAWVADAPANGSTILLPLLASEIGRTAPGDTIDYEVSGEAVTDSSNPGDGLVDVVEGRASMSIFGPAVSTGDYLLLDRRQSTTLTLEVDQAALAEDPALGWMIVTLDDANGIAQADTIPIPDLP